MVIYESWAFAFAFWFALAIAFVFSFAVVFSFPLFKAQIKREQTICLYNLGGLTLSPDQSAGRLLQVTEALVSLPVSPAHSS